MEVCSLNTGFVNERLNLHFSNALGSKSLKS